MNGLLSQLTTSLRITAVTMAICSGIYMLVILAIGQVFVPESANGSILYGDRGEAIGSELIAQSFTKPAYLWPRPSAVNYDSSASGGSNLSPASTALRERVMQSIAMYPNADRLIPADLVTTSGSGLDPHITLSAALLQADRIATARNLAPTIVEKTIALYISRPGWILTDEPLVNVLLVNRELDRLKSRS